MSERENRIYLVISLCFFLPLLFSYSVPWCVCLFFVCLFVYLSFLISLGLKAPYLVVVLILITFFITRCTNKQLLNNNLSVWKDKSVHNPVCVLGVKNRVRLCVITVFK